MAGPNAFYYIDKDKGIITGNDIIQKMFVELFDYIATAKRAEMGGPCLVPTPLPCGLCYFRFWRNRLCLVLMQGCTFIGLISANSVGLNISSSNGYKHGSVALNISFTSMVPRQLR